MKLKDSSKFKKEFERKIKKQSPQIMKAKHIASPKSSKKSKLSFLQSDSPQLKGVTGYLWKVSILHKNL